MPEQRGGGGGGGEGGREGEREGEREGGRAGRREGGREGGREGDGHMLRPTKIYCRHITACLQLHYTHP